MSSVEVVNWTDYCDAELSNRFILKHSKLRINHPWLTCNEDVPESQLKWWHVWITAIHMQHSHIHANYSSLPWHQIYPTYKTPLVYFSIFNSDSEQMQLRIVNNMFSNGRNTAYIQDKHHIYLRNTMPITKFYTRQTSAKVNLETR